MRPLIDLDDEAWVLRHPEGMALLAEVAAHPVPRPADVARWRRSHDAGRTSAAIRLAEGRARGLAKFSKAASMWTDPVGLEQSTSEEVARWKALRFAGAVVADLCSGLGGDAIAIAGAATRVVALDADAGMARRLRWNADVYGVGDRLHPVVGRVDESPIVGATLVHVDPDRRPGGAPRAGRWRPIRPAWTACCNCPERSAGCVQAEPADDFDRHFSGATFEVELISLKGECKESTVWFGSLAGCRRRATCLPDGATWTDRDAPREARPFEVNRPLAWIYDPDPTLDRAGLLERFAAAHGLGRIGTRRDAVTSADRVDSPFLTAFEVVEAMPLDRKLMRAWLAARGIGVVEIKPRGVALNPTELRRDLHPQGSETISIFLVEAERGRRAIMARRASARGLARPARR